jgi:hypothetical protein
MKPLPSDPYAFQARVMEALLGDIRNLETTSFPRLNALRQISISTEKERARPTTEPGK